MDNAPFSLLTVTAAGSSLTGRRHTLSSRTVPVKPPSPGLSLTFLAFDASQPGWVLDKGAPILYFPVVGWMITRKLVEEDTAMSDRKFIFVITHSYDRPDLAAGALQLAANMKAFGNEVDFFLMDNGAALAKKGFAKTLTWQRKDQFAPLHELMNTLIEDFGCRFYICASCVKHFGLDEVELIANSEVKPGSFLAEMLEERQALTF